MCAWAWFSLGGTRRARATSTSATQRRLSSSLLRAASAAGRAALWHCRTPQNCHGSRRPSSSWNERTHHASPTDAAMVMHDVPRLLLNKYPPRAMSHPYPSLACLAAGLFVGPSSAADLGEASMLV